MAEFHIGQRVRIKDNAYGDDAKQPEIEARGKIGKIAGKSASGGDWWIVLIPGSPNIEYLRDDEIELAD